MDGCDMRKDFGVCIILGLLLVSGLKAEHALVPEAWLSTEDLSARLEKVPLSVADDASRAEILQVVVDDHVVYQTIDGWGASMTGASAWLLTYQLTDAKRREVMRQLFTEEGIHLSLLRQPIGASDFNHEIYSYCDEPGDFDLETFSISRDTKYIIPRIREAQLLNPHLRTMASPWSPPGWMKTSGSMIGGELLPEHYGTFAQYLLKFLQAYYEEGVPVFAITPQNEPNYLPPHYPGMLMNAQEQSDFIANHLGPLLHDSDFRQVKIICHDHNYDTVDYAKEVLSSRAGKYVAGSGFHHYGGPIEAMSELHNEFPYKDIWFTEGGFGDWNTQFDNIGMELIKIPRNWSKSIVLWNIALDQNDQPAVLKKHNGNDGLLLIRSDRMDDVTYNAMYYYIGHLSKFVKPGAIRIESPMNPGVLDTVAFRNCDSSVVLLTFNPQTTSQVMEVAWKGNTFQHTVPARSFMTFVWK